MTTKWIILAQETNSYSETSKHALCGWRISYVCLQCMYVCTYVCLYVFTYVFTHVCMYACMYVCMDGWMHACMHEYAIPSVAIRSDVVFCWTLYWALAVIVVCAIMWAPSSERYTHLSMSAKAKHYKGSFWGLFGGYSNHIHIFIQAFGPSVTHPLIRCTVQPRTPQ